MDIPNYIDDKHIFFLNEYRTKSKNDTKYGKSTVFNIHVVVSALVKKFKMPEHVALKIASFWLSSYERKSRKKGQHKCELCDHCYGAKKENCTKSRIKKSKKELQEQMEKATKIEHKDGTLTLFFGKSIFRCQGELVYSLLNYGIIEEEMEKRKSKTGLFY